MIDDGESIQRAIDECPLEGGEVVVKAGTYICKNPIVIDRDNIYLRGQGPSTVLRLSDGANSPVVVVGQTIPSPDSVRRNITVSDLSIDANRLNQDSEYWTTDCTSAQIRNNGITLRRAEDVIIERVNISSARSGGLVAELGCKRVTVRDFVSSDNHFDGLAGYETENSIFSGLYLHNNCAAGLSFDRSFNHNSISNAVITYDANIGCESSLSGKTLGIFMRDSHDNLFRGIQIRNSGEHGIFLAQADDDPEKSASGNVFSEILVSESGGAGLRVNDSTCINNLVCASQFIANRNGAIDEDTKGLVQSFCIICR